jgi:phospholipid/cholesterol/gamma-HCH transport system ATP-binding protein
MSQEVVLRVKGLGKRFEGVCVLDGIDFELRAGEIVGLIGPGGSGKSVFVKLSCGLLTPDRGEIEVLGQNLRQLAEKDRQKLRTRIGLSFQNYALFDFMTVGENVAFPLAQDGAVAAPEIARRVQQRLNEVGLPLVAGLMPNELSGGMRKRVGLARATIANAELVFYDDPTAGLDPVTSSKIFNLIRDLQIAHRSSSIIVSHDVDRMRAVCDRYVLLYDCQIRFAGTADDALRSRDPIVHEFFQRDVGVDLSLGHDGDPA